MTPEQRRAHARIAALSRWASEDAREGTRPTREGWRRRFLDLVDPDRVLPAPERERRAERAIRAHMTRLATKSAKARRRAS